MSILDTNRATVLSFDPDTDGVDHPELGTKVIATAYDHVAKVGRIFMSDSCSTDMRGAINYFTRIDPDVQAVWTYNADGADTFYSRLRRRAKDPRPHEWTAFAPWESGHPEYEAWQRRKRGAVSS